MAKICPLFSGSSGNSTYISTASGGVLVDAGVSFKRINEALLSVDGSIDNIKAVAITHEHEDHIKGLKTLLKKTQATLIATSGTLSWLEEKDKIPKGTNIIETNGKPIEVGEIVIESFLTSHDSRQSCGYNLTFKDGKRASVCTDLGVITDSVRKAISKSDLVLIESNHDIDMLKRGPYPPHLKMRIMSENGHISNNVCAAELKNLINSGTTRFILGHLSQNNNTPLIARSCAEAALMDLGAQNGRDYLLYVASTTGNGVTVI